MPVTTSNYFLASVPRSGSSWVGAVLASSPSIKYRFQPNFAYTFPFTINNESTEVEINRFLDELSKTNDPFVTGQLRIDGTHAEFSPEEPRNEQFTVWKEVHNLTVAEALLRLQKSKLIALIRNPYGVLASWKQSKKEFNSDWDFRKEWYHGQSKNSEYRGSYFGFAKWVEATQLFFRLQEEFPDDVIIIRYEDLIQDPLLRFESLYNKIEIPFTEPVKSFIQESRSRTSKSQYGVHNSKKVDDKWMSVLPDNVVEQIRIELADLDMMDFT